MSQAKRNERDAAGHLLAAGHVDGIDHSGQRRRDHDVGATRPSRNHARDLGVLGIRRASNRFRSKRPDWIGPGG